MKEESVRRRGRGHAIDATLADENPTYRDSAANSRAKSAAVVSATGGWTCPRIVDTSRPSLQGTIS